MSAELAIGVDVGGTKAAAGLVAADGSVRAEAILPTPARTPGEIEDAIVALVTELTRTQPAVAVGIGAAGWVDSNQAVVRFSPHLAWREEPLRERLRERIGIPVLVDNDANAAAWAEHRFGAGRRASVLVCITLGTGIGGALLTGGALFRGAYGMAGEWGHLCVVPDGHWCACGNRGCWEQYASGDALVRDARALVGARSPRAAALRQACAGDPDLLTGPMITAAALAGDEAARELIADSGRWLGRGIAGLAAALDPDLVLVGGGLSEAGTLLLEPAREAYARTLAGRGSRPLTQIAPAALGTQAGLVGAADLARCALHTPPPGPRAAFWPSPPAP